MAIGKKIQAAQGCKANRPRKCCSGGGSGWINCDESGSMKAAIKEKFIGTSSKNLSELENVINDQAAKGYRLHTISTTSAHSTGLGGGDRIQATMVFEKL